MPTGNLPLPTPTKASNTHTIQVSDQGGGEYTAAVPLPLRVRITDTISGSVFTIQQGPAGIIISVDQKLVIRPNASNSVLLQSEGF